MGLKGVQPSKVNGLYVQKAVQADYGMSKAAITELSDILQPKVLRKSAVGSKTYAEDHVKE